jgi:dUTP pyrophosphatase
MEKPSQLHILVEKLPHYDDRYALPIYETSGAAGADVRAQLEGGEGARMIIHPGQRVLIPTGLKLAIPAGFEVQVRPRSGLSFKTGLMVLNAPGTIDSDYRGEVKIILGNLGDKEEVIEHGDRVAQFILAPVFQAAYIAIDKSEGEQLSFTHRGEGGFGSTGKK